MRGTANRNYAVIDDFLSPQEHLGLWEAFQDIARSPGIAGEWNRTYQLTNGEAPVSSTCMSRKSSLRDEGTTDAPGPSLLRAFGEKLCALMIGDQPAIVIPPWTGFTVSAWTYRPGMGLEWHSDTGWLGAFVYYVHPVWRSSWGGELLVAADDATPSGIAPAVAADWRRDVETVCRTGGAFIYPRPNRLVLLRGGTLHCIKKVESGAGPSFRASLSGFFFHVSTASG